MYNFVVVFTALLALTAARSVKDDLIRTNQPILLEPPKRIAVEPRSLSSKGQDALENFISKLPCGWPDAGIPPLAPYTREKIEFELKKSFAEIFGNFERVRVDGLDILLIEKLKINYTFSQKVKFNLLWPKIVISGKLMGGAFLNLMQKYGISLKYEGNGDFEVVLENIIFEGQFKYKMPYIFGSIKIYKFEGSITLGNVVSEVNGIFGEGKLKQLLDDYIEDTLLKAVSLNQDKISGMLKDDLVPYLNSKLKGHKIWSIIKAAFGKEGKICYPPADPWLRS